MKSRYLILITLLSAQTQAADLDNIGALLQPGFKDLSTDLTAALSYKAVTPAEPLGITGFDVGIELGATKLEHSAAWLTASGHDTDWLPVPKLHISKGLPFDTDIGAFYTQVPSSNIKLWGVSASHALMSGSAVTPALSIRGAYTRLTGVSQLDFDTKSVDLSISKGLLMFTPFAGAGYVWGNSKPNVGGLTSESVGLPKIYAGLNFNLLLGNAAVEVDKTGDNMTYSVKLGLRF